ncbi:MAG: 30S ribosomal protein S17 [Phycisphaerales bacterium]|nr:30S ribosomal protein S17 [Phycisphaerales bacterium]MBT7171599.1 30S ribosomal protein S17 [Phycisphaerales bacterium]
MTEDAKQTTMKLRRARVGEVTSISGTKSVVVTVENLVRHAQYGKYIRRHSKFQVHDEKGIARLGALVEIVPCRPLSKTKAHRVVREVRPPVGVQA